MNNDDNLNLTKAMNGPVSAGFMAAIKKGIETLINMKAVVVVDKESWIDIISSVLAFRHKRFFDGEIYKLKVRICASSFEQKEGIGHFETFALIVQLMTVCVCLLMIILFNFHNKQIDYTAAVLLQTPVDHYVYVEFLKMFTSPGNVWLLKMVLYGLKDAPRAYFINTKNKLEDLGY